jgi:hypothetical protein
VSRGCYLEWLDNYDHSLSSSKCQALLLACKSSVCLIKLYDIKMYRGVYEQLNTLLNLGLDGGEQSV